MKSKILAVAVLLAFSGVAFAQANGNAGTCGFGASCDGGIGQNQGQAQGQGQGQAQGQLQGQGQAQGQGQIGINKSYNSNSNKASAYSGASSYSKGGNAQQAQGQVGIVANKGNSNNITFQDSGRADVHYSGSYELKNVPAVVAPNIYPSSPCMGSSSAAGAGVGFGLSFGTSWTDEECQKMEAARNAPSAEDKKFVWCQGKFNAGAPSCKGLAKAAALEADKVAAARPASARDGDDKRRSATVVSTDTSGIVADSQGRLWKKDGEYGWEQVNASGQTF